MTQRRTEFRDEFGIVPDFMVPIAAIGFACMMYVFLNYMPQHDPHAPPFPVRLFLGAMLGCVVAAYLLLIGYVNQDAKRRNMGQLLWTLLVILIPNGIGFLAYFLLRKPLLEACPKCGEIVEKGFRYCPKCGDPLTPTCGQCGQAVSPDYNRCPYCGGALALRNI
jgi:RNA polymerase subunit RPABC4/transcription elongation factor Spt4